MICACSLPGPRPKRQVHIFRKRRLEEAIHHARLECTKKETKDEKISAAEHDLKLKDSDQVYDI